MEKNVSPLICQLPYPTTQNLAKDLRTANIIYFAYNGQKGEKTAMQLYHKYSQMLNNQDAQLMKQIYLAEQLHLKLLHDALLSLGYKLPQHQASNSNTYLPESNRHFANYNNVIMQAIATKLTTIVEYKKMLYLIKNTDVQQIIEHIVMDENLHLQALQSMIKMQASNSTISPNIQDMAFS